MKIFSILNNYNTGLNESNTHSGTFWTIVPDSVMLRSGKPMFLPQEDKSYMICPSICLRIGKLGKRVESRFAYRYIDAMAPATAIIPCEAIPKFQEEVIPQGGDWLFDGAVIIGDFTDIPQGKEELERTLKEATISLNHNGKNTKWEGARMHREVPEIISSISYYNTIKSGDMILAGINTLGVLAHIDTPAEATLNGIPRLKFNVK